MVCLVTDTRQPGEESETTAAHRKPTLGAMDLLTKSFNPSEVFAHVAALAEQANNVMANPA